MNIIQFLLTDTAIRESLLIIEDSTGSSPMGMLINGKWDNKADQSMVDGAYRREQSALPTSFNDDTLKKLRDEHN